jgi:hypothetical protein
MTDGASSEVRKNCWSFKLQLLFNPCGIAIHLRLLASIFFLLLQSSAIDQLKVSPVFDASTHNLQFIFFLFLTPPLFFPTPQTAFNPPTISKTLDNHDK